MTMVPACPLPCAIKCYSEECALTKPHPARDWDWQLFGILPNFMRGRSHWKTRRWAVCARGYGCAPECAAEEFAPPEAIRSETHLQPFQKPSWYALGTLMKMKLPQE